MTERQRQIATLAAAAGIVVVEELADRFDVTPQTIRRDLNLLCGRGVLARTHGGARPLNSVSNVRYEERHTRRVEAKRRIGLAAAARIAPQSSLIINIGTTTEQVARAIRNHRDLLVITNNIHVVNILAGTPAKELLLAGGVVRQSDGGVVGDAAVQFMRQFRADLAVIGTSAVDPDGTLLDFDYREVSVARAIVESARRVMLVLDHTKFERRATVRICGIDQVDVVVTDQSPPPPFVALCEREGVEIVVAEEALAGEEAVVEDHVYG